jgi:hypothetical protein
MKPGPLFERELMLWFQRSGFPGCRRLGAQGANDCGDLDGVDGWLISAKRTSAEDIGRCCTAAEKQARRAGKRRWVVIRRRRNHALGLAYVTMSLETFTELIGGSTCTDPTATCTSPPPATARR